MYRTVHWAVSRIGTKSDITEGLIMHLRQKMDFVSNNCSDKYCSPIPLATLCFARLRP